MVNPLFVAADVGNARIKLGLFEEKEEGLESPEQLEGLRPQTEAVPVSLPEVLRTLLLPDEKGNSPHLPKQAAAPPSFQFDRIGPWLADISQKSFCWRVASVNRPTATQLIGWLHEHRPADSVVLLASGDISLKVRLPRPDMVGIDRLMDALAANYLRKPDRPAAVIDVGTAITVDIVSAEGVFLGGAILPGIEMAARALHHFTDLLPLVDTSDFGPPPPPIGIDTVSAIQAGLYWGAIGAIRELVERQCETAKGNRPQIFLTGGAGAAAADLLGPDVRHVPNLTLSGIALGSCRLQPRGR